MACLYIEHINFYLNTKLHLNWTDHKKNFCRRKNRQMWEWLH